ncbi:MAG: Xaa-Pro dipeptidase [Pseudohongiellaceae bacterium]|jgi:Xaa-Pro dipeptidase
MNSALFSAHITHLQSIYEQALDFSAGAEFDAVLIHSGSEKHYFGDDRGVPFQSYGHFLHWLPVNRPEQCLLIQRGEKPKYIQVIPSDYWYDQSIDLDESVANAVNIVRLTKVDQIAAEVALSKIAYIGEEANKYSALLGPQISCNPKKLLGFLDYHRAYKTEYEISQLRSANQTALIGHAAAKEAFTQGGTEYDIHQAYLNACQILENEAPYTNIVAVNEKSAILHYQNKRRDKSTNNHVLLIDAGYRCNGYGSDITRTSVTASAHPVFVDLLKGMETIELALVAAVKPGISYVDIHVQTLKMIGELLLRLEIVTCDSDTLFNHQLTQVFMPHGVGHLLGVQVHDVAGFQQDIHGTQLSAPSHSPNLRNTRLIEKDMVFTIEPGCYFIPMLLEPHRSSTFKSLFNWPLIDQLIGNGGIRIEDNVLVTDSGSANLTRGS